MKSDAAIERETARKWAERAIIAHRRYVETKDLKWLMRFSDYKHEALEHAATVGDRGRFVAKMQDKIDKAAKAMKRKIR